MFTSLKPQASSFKRISLPLAACSLWLSSCQLTDHTEGHNDEITAEQINVPASGYQTVDTGAMPAFTFDAAMDTIRTRTPEPRSVSKIAASVPGDSRSPPPTRQTIAWTVIFFFASAAASSAYLTASECFPLEIRAVAIAFFYAVGTGIGGVGAPWLFGALIDTGSRASLFGGYLLGAGLMMAAGLIALRFGVDAERRPLEAVAKPLSAAD